MIQNNQWINLCQIEKKSENFNNRSLHRSMDENITYQVPMKYKNPLHNGFLSHEKKILVSKYSESVLLLLSSSDII